MGNRIGARPLSTAPTVLHPGGGPPGTRLPVPGGVADENKYVGTSADGTTLVLVAPQTTLPGSAGNALKILRVNAGGTGYELVLAINPPAPGSGDVGKSLQVVAGPALAYGQPGNPTAWTAITAFGTGMSNQSFGYAAAARIINGDTVELCGQIGGAAGVIATPGPTTLATLPAQFHPASSCFESVTCSFPGGATSLDERLTIGTDGTLVVGGITAHAWASLDGVRFRLT